MDVLTAAQQLFRQWLIDGNSPGTPYLYGEGGHRRPVPDDIAQGAGYGYAWAGYAALLVEWGYRPEDLLHAGLIDDQGLEVYGDRLTFPWTDMAGRTVLGLGGRAVTPRRPKYVNTPEPLFSKGHAVFGIAQAAAAIHQAGWALVVEGPFDATALWTMGWSNSVATVGAKVTLDQLTMVARLTDTVVVLLDADEGGKRGRDALANLLQRSPLPGSLEVHTATLGSSKDPDDPSTTPEDIVAALQGALPLAHI